MIPVGDYLQTSKLPWAGLGYLYSANSALLFTALFVFDKLNLASIRA